ncbi:MAG: GNAT family N-acetyltransferase [Eubacterium sp.]|nr:GNAT family N-acetyltransferase [Eubacterium sp.]
MSYKFETERLIIQTSDPDLDAKMLKYYYDNKAFFEEHEPAQPDQYFTLPIQRRILEQEAQNMENKVCAYYYFALKENPDLIIGSISFIRIRKEPYANVVFGYNLHEKYQGNGYCTEACKASIEDVLKFAPIHRIEARAMVDNYKSINVLERCGFSYEGIERKSILLGGEFRDHLRYAYINENYQSPGISM